MLPDRVKTQADTLRKALAARGWSVRGVERPFEDEWWAAEVWEIESEWSPRGSRAWLTFLVDPLGGPEDIWAVWASPARPARAEAGTGPLLRLRNVWRQGLPGFVQALHRFRADPPT